MDFWCVDCHYNRSGEFLSLFKPSTICFQITNVQFANDEGDPGMGIELGLNAFLFGGKALHSTVRHLLTTGYELVDREPFGKIITAHLNRRKGPGDVFVAE